MPTKPIRQELALIILIIYFEEGEKTIKIHSIRFRISHCFIWKFTAFIIFTL